MTSEQTADGPAPTATGPATFRPVPLVALVAVGFVVIGLSPIAFQGGAWFLLFLLPLLPAWWLVRTRTIVDGTALRVLLAWGSRRVPWDDVVTLRVAERGWVRAVGRDEGEVALVGVRPRDLGRVAAASEGRIDMPTPDEVAAVREHQRELEATRMRIARLRDRQAAGSEEATGSEKATGSEESPEPTEPGTDAGTESTAGNDERRA
ncbi:PH domain-containing protein [Actinomycetospora lutea]|uniref:PH domain-containing protein n=1 Tax=Actinomycetospora lutea TaxID=663604 RepID=UPI002367227E|nr:PH domain-containing protein [Actinomycetospora lutea]MDD7940386.1 PH domain-containing protein [Actinomycetospora lutea]